MEWFYELICKVFGHSPLDINTLNFTGECKRCGYEFDASFNPLSGTWEESKNKSNKEDSK